MGISQFERLGVCGGGGPGQQHSPEDQETVRGRPLRPGLLSDPGKFPGHWSSVLGSQISADSAMSIESLMRKNFTKLEGKFRLHFVVREHGGVAGSWDYLSSFTIWD